MFGFLKEKLQKAIKLFTRKVDEEGEEEVKQVERKAPVKPASAKKPEVKKPVKVEPKKSVPEKQVVTKAAVSKKPEVKTTKAQPKPSVKQDTSKQIKKPLPIVTKTKTEIREEIKKESELEKRQLTKIKGEIKEVHEALREIHNLEEKHTEVAEKIKGEKVKHVQEEIKQVNEEVAEVAEERKGFFQKLFGFGKKKEAPMVSEKPKDEFASEEEGTEEELVEKELAEETETESVEHITSEKVESEIEEEVEAEEEEQIVEGEKESETESEEEEAEEIEEAAPEKKGFFGKLIETITTKKISDKQFEELFWDLEVALLENNVAVEVIDKIKADLRKELVGVAIPRSQVMRKIEETLENSIDELFDAPDYDLFGKIQKKNALGEPFVIVFVGVNGSGKTTTIAKFTHMLKKHNLSVVIAAADTFRAAAIDQLEKHATALGVKLIKHDYGSDAAAVAFDAIAHARANSRNVVLIDTAGRLHSNTNLMDELRKVVRVAKPDSVLFIGESITGNDCVEQAKNFNLAAGIDGIILSKADVDEKGGAAISVTYVTKKPILYLGVGQTYDDLIEFDPELIKKNLFGED